MSRTMIGIAAVLALIMSQAWAGDEQGEDEQAATDAAASSTVAEEGAAEGVTRTATATEAEVEASRGRGAMTESSGVRASHEERWLREREGYRDGGY